MSIETQARALMVRHQNMVQRRQQAMLSRAAENVGLTGESVNTWIHNQGKSRPSAEMADGSARVGLS
ncbi:MAG: hypothetical protein VKJ24_04960 [Synechococcales bacterium]|nr:hypothetical protein [Synechococcales bacterium]